MRLIDESTGRVVVESLEVADTFWSRLVGLQFRRSLPANAGLLIVPCGSVHTCFVRFAIDLVFLDRTGNVLGVKPRVRPWRIAFAPRGTYAILELAGEGAEPIAPGGRLLLALDADADRPWLRFLSRFD
jgi:uncharacterized membrane protein (UPF0127 family)